MKLSPVARYLGTIPNRLQLAGGWIDQPFVSRHNPGPPGLLGLYEGIPLTSRTSQYSGVLPDHITIYQQAICAICRTEPEVAEQVRRTVIHEVGHYFGISDGRLRELGW